MINPMGFTADETDAAHAKWGCNCGPASIAAVCGLTLDQVRTHMGDFDRKGYTNPSLMWGALRRIGVKFHWRGGHLGKDNWPHYGMARIQWEGPWTRPEMPPRVAYRHTHWVGVNTPRLNETGIFDINATGNGTGWIRLDDWTRIMVPFIIRECVPRGSGDWYITHAVEVVR